MFKLAAILVFAIAAAKGQLRSSDEDLTGSIGAIRYLDPAPVVYATNGESIESKKAVSQEVEAPRNFDNYVKRPQIVLNEDTEIVEVEAPPSFNYAKEEALVHLNGEDVEIVQVEEANPQNQKPGAVFTNEDVEIVRVAAPYIRIEGDSIQYLNRDEYKRAVLLRNPETRRNIVQFLIPDTEPDKK